MSLPDMKVDKFEKESFYSDVVKKSQGFSNKDFEPLEQYSKRGASIITPDKQIISHKLNSATRMNDGSFMMSNIMHTSQSLGALQYHHELLKS